MLTLWLPAADLPAAFEAANRLYEQGKFADAIASYEKVTHEGPVSAALYFNLGNALFKAGQTGRAIAAYRQAEELAPRDPDVRANLRFARNKASGGQASPPSVARRALASLRVDEWTWLAVGAVWIWFGLLALGQWRIEWKRNLAGWTVASGLVAAALCASLAAALETRARHREAVVVTSELVVRFGPLEESKSFYTVRDGVELRVLGRKDDWLQVTDSAQRTGWVRRNQVVVFPPS